MTTRQFIHLALGIIAGFTFLALVTGAVDDGDRSGAVIWALAGGCSLLSLVSLALTDRRGRGKRCDAGAHDSKVPASHGARE